MVRDGEDWHRLQTKKKKKSKEIFSICGSRDVDSLNIKTNLLIE